MEAEATGFIHLRPDTISMIKENEGHQDSVIRRAETAGIRAAGNTGSFVPLLQPVTLTGVNVKAYVYPNGIEIKCIVRSAGQTGLETEALAAVSVALLSLFESCKSTDSSAAIAEIRITRKTHPEQ